ncbi:MULTISPECIES: hypothetical protein [Streptomycetaceae]|uniref:YggT family protein n=1 Tax=Kitasatospora herbaricolor TaxID=68217 RepID=A0ABZ1W4E7_9ACTN|nr:MULTISPECIES: hypothetical protein [Streptomycetaceae]MDQ0311879.1 uncharacterized protein involved in cysteine biosynthesis [Kitasatospora herbaricolor]OKI30965.1 hypothetical protein A6A07_02640 [Streptomyces sp. CB03911]GGU96974.1 hypothetical protein GCM10010495_04070 [Kitasatospora herbaricolor]
MKGLFVVIRVLANAAVAVLVVWILLRLLGANTGNPVVHWIEQAADWLAAWSRGIFQVAGTTLQLVLDYGLAALVYGVVGNLGARREWT